MKYFIIVALCGLLLTGSLAAFANEAIVAGAKRVSAQSCSMREDGHVNVNFNGTETDVLKVKSIIDGKIQEVTDIAHKAGIEIEVQSAHYSANKNSSSCGDSGSRGGYQITGNMSLKVSPAEKVSALTAALDDKGYNVSFSVNTRRQCSGGGE